MDRKKFQDDRQERIDGLVQGKANDRISRLATIGVSPKPWPGRCATRRGASVPQRAIVITSIDDLC